MSAPDMDRLKAEVRAACRQAGLGTYPEAYFLERLDDAFALGQKWEHDAPSAELRAAELRPVVGELRRMIELLDEHKGSRGMRCMSAGRRVPSTDERREVGGILHARCYGCGQLVPIVLGTADAETAPGRVVRGVR